MVESNIESNSEPKSIKSIVGQLVDSYYKNEYWHKHKLAMEEAIKYHDRLLDTGNIIYYEENDELLGYAEFWRVNYEQWGRIVCGEHFSAYLENVQDGNICYVANIWIKPEARRSHTIKVLKLMFFKLNSHCDYFVGEALQKRTQPIKVFRRENLQSRLFKEGRYDG